MFCHKCGNQVGEDSEFCHKCGTKMVISENTPHQQVQVAQTPHIQQALEIKPLPESVVDEEVIATYNLLAETAYCCPKIKKIEAKTVEQDIDAFYVRGSLSVFTNANNGGWTFIGLNPVWLVLFLISIITNALFAKHREKYYIKIYHSWLYYLVSIPIWILAGIFFIMFFDEYIYDFPILSVLLLFGCIGWCTLRYFVYKQANEIRAYVEMVTQKSVYPLSTLPIIIGYTFNLICIIFALITLASS